MWLILGQAYLLLLYLLVINVNSILYYNSIACTNVVKFVFNNIQLKIVFQFILVHMQMPIYVIYSYNII